MTDSEYSNLQNNQTFYYYGLSNGSYYRASGVFSPPSYDTWYFLFINMDPDEQTTYLTYNVEILNRDSDNESLLFPIIGVVFTIIIIGGCAAAVSQSKKKREEAILTPAQPPQQQEQAPQIQQPNNQKRVKFCINCGTPHNLYANYCENCGTVFPQ